ncbi:MAG: multiheme c-type cytochrome [Gemmatimonadales bacterium]
MSPRRGVWAMAGAVCILALGACAPKPVPKPEYVGRTACASCHATEDSLWQGSHHAQAMAVADSTTVLGNFENATYTYNGLTSRFFRRDGQYWVNTEGPDGTMVDYPISYTFGVYPLQQYLIAFPRGRYQALGIAWDTRTKAEGGQRWYHLYPGEQVDHRDVLHWTGVLQNWNFMCAQCHSTNLQKGYSEAADSYATTWSEIDVSCEACHGPGSNHVALAEGRKGTAGAWTGGSGLTVSFHDTAATAWIMDPATGIARRSAPRANRMEVETCGLCHARRGQVWPDSGAGQILAQTQRVALLDEGLYFADGQQDDEVYEYGSFVQSKMYRAGVTCSDCHDAHRSTTRVTDNAVCATCHLPTRYDTTAHTHHAAGTAGAGCVDCHMTPRNYMGVDARRDHGMKIPRPDLTASTGAPNACTACHGDKSVAWAAAQAEAWYGAPDTVPIPVAVAIARAWSATPGAGDVLVAISRDTARAGITRATAISLMAQNPARYSIGAIQIALSNPDPLIRRAAVEQVELLDPSMRAPMALPMLSDSVRTVRLAALPTVAGLPDSGWSAPERAAFARVLAEYRTSQRYNADRPESWANLGNLESRLGDPAAAVANYLHAIQLAPQFVPAYTQLAEVYRTAGQESQADSILRAGLQQVPGSTDLKYQLGLALVRQQRIGDALPYLKAAAASGMAHYAYVYGVALFEVGQQGQAITELQKALTAAPDNQELLYGLASIAAAAGQRDVALPPARKLARMNPDNQEIQQFLAQLEGAPGQ